MSNAANGKSVSPGIDVLVRGRVESMKGGLVQIVTKHGSAAYPNGTAFGLEVGQIEVDDGTGKSQPSDTESRLASFLEKNFKAGINHDSSLADNVITLIQKLAKAAE